MTFGGYIYIYIWFWPGMGPQTNKVLLRLFVLVSSKYYIIASQTACLRPSFERCLLGRFCGL